LLRISKAIDIPVNGTWNRISLLVSDECNDPREDLIIALLNDIEKEGTIIAYNMSFEKRVISNLAQKFPKYEKDLNNLIERFVDLIEPFRNLGVYHYNFNGSFSIKSVLPALFDDDNLNYKNLGLIQNGGDAMDAFVNLCYEKDENLKQWLSSCAVAVNDKIVDSLDVELKSGDKVMLLPPVCGG